MFPRAYRKDGFVNKEPVRNTFRAYRFPRAYENYEAVTLVQNSTTNYLNDMNMYGNDNELVIDEI